MSAAVPFEHYLATTYHPDCDYVDAPYPHPGYLLFRTPDELPRQEDFE